MTLRATKIPSLEQSHAHESHAHEPNWSNGKRGNSTSCSAPGPRTNAHGWNGNHGYGMPLLATPPTPPPLISAQCLWCHSLWCWIQPPLQGTLFLQNTTKAWCFYICLCLKEFFYNSDSNDAERPPMANQKGRDRLPISTGSPPWRPTFIQSTKAPRKHHQEDGATISQEMRGWPLPFSSNGWQNLR